MRSFMLGVLLLVGCSDNSSGTLTLVPDTHQVAVGAYTFVTAYLVDSSMGSGSGSNGMAVNASWSVDMQGIVTLSQMSTAEKVTGDAVGHVVVTASFDGQTAQTGFTVTGP
jgi:hypothetical protein